MENEKKVTPGKIALAVVAVVVLAAAFVAILLTGRNSSGTVEMSVPADAIVETAEATIPADGNPDDETAKGSYTASDEEVLAQRETVVARMGD